MLLYPPGFSYPNYAQRERTFYLSFLSSISYLLHKIHQQAFEFASTQESSIMSGPSAYKFNNAEDPNDAGALQKAISGMEIGKPETFGGTSASRTYFFYQLRYELLIMKFQQAVYTPQPTKRYGMISSIYTLHLTLLDGLASSRCLVFTSSRLLKG